MNVTKIKINIVKYYPFDTGDNVIAVIDDDDDKNGSQDNINYMSIEYLEKV